MRLLLPMLLVVFFPFAGWAGDPGQILSETSRKEEPEKSEKEDGSSVDRKEGEKGLCSRKTLLKWNLEEEEKKEGDSGEPEGEEPLAADRPDFTESSSTVGKGRVQLESGYTFTSDRQNGRTVASHSYPEALLRVGLFADWFEFRIQQNFLNEQTTRGLRTRRGSGAEDLYLGLKFALTEQQGYLPESALVLQTTAPSGSPDFTTDEMLPGIAYWFGWDVVKDCFTIGGGFQANREQDGTGNYYVELAPSFTLGFDLTKKLGMYTEWYALFPTGAQGRGTGPEHYMDGGFIYRVSPNFQLDIRAGMGLNRRADNFFTGAGFVVRY